MHPKMKSESRISAVAESLQPTTRLGKWGGGGGRVQGLGVYGGSKKVGQGLGFVGVSLELIRVQGLSSRGIQALGLRVVGLPKQELS